MIKSIEIQNFRGIEKLEISDLGRINIFVGRNGVGKTSILEAVAICATGGRPQYFNMLSQLRGMKGFSESNPAGLTSFFKRPINETPQKIVLCDHQSGCYITEVKHAPISEIRDTNDTSILQAKFPALTQTLDVTTDYQFAYEHPGQKEKTIKHERILRLARDAAQVLKDDSCSVCPHGFYMRGGFINLERANDLVDSLLREKGMQGLDDLKKMLSVIMPELRQILPSSKTDGPLLEIGVGKTIPAAVAGGGFVWAISIYAEMLLNGKSFSVAVIDEIETGLHHTSMRGMWQNLLVLLNTLPEAQIFCSTHSEELLEKTLDIFAPHKDLLRVIRVMRERDGELSLINQTFDDLLSIKESNAHVS